MIKPDLLPPIPWGVALGHQLQRTTTWDGYANERRRLLEYVVVTDFWYDPTRIEFRKTYDRDAGWMMAVLPIGACGTPWGRKRSISVKGMKRAGWTFAEKDAIAHGYALIQGIETGKVTGIWQRKRWRT